MTLSFELVAATTRTSPEEIARMAADPGFVAHFSDHMASATWTAEAGWTDSKIENYHPFEMAPGGAILHYAQEVFEGLKLYRHADGSIWFFRPEMNARRMINSAIRLDLPILPEEDFLRSVHGLAKVDAAWVPSGAGMSYYMRPFMFADETFLGVHTASRATYAVIGGPAGTYFSDGVHPVDIWVTTTYSRAGNGGTGAVKCGGNYASSLIAQREGEAHGCPQVLFTDAASHEWVEELGGMNFFAVTTDRQLLTPPTSGTILPGITRDSILTLAGDLGLTPQVRPISLTELYAGIASGTIREVFACGTAAVITPIGALKHQGEEGEESITLAEPVGQMTSAIRQALIDIQWGRAEDRYQWMRRVEV